LLGFFCELAVNSHHRQLCASSINPPFLDARSTSRLVNVKYQ